MGYYVTPAPDYDYYEGDQLSSLDIAVSQRPYHTCDWDGAAWVYDLPDTREHVKNIYSRAMEADLLGSLYSSSEPGNLATLIGAAYMLLDLVAYTDNVANNVPFIDGYRVITGESLADAVVSLTGYGDIGGVVLGKCLAQRRIDFALIDAAATGAAIIAITYSRPF